MMATNGMDVATHLMLEEEQRGVQKIDRHQNEIETSDDFTLGPLVDKIAMDLAKGLAAAMKELSRHIGSETRRLGEAVELGLDSLQIGLQDLSRFTEEQRSTNGSVEDQLLKLTAASADLREGHARQEVELETLRTEARDFSTAVSHRFDVSLAALQESDARQVADLAALRGDTEAALQPVAERIDKLCRDLGIQQEDIAATKTTLYSRIDAVVERLDRQADAVRLLHTAYAQQDTELEQIVDRLAQLRAHPKPLLADGL
jgi:chromosome segregation ATPase